MHRVLPSRRGAVVSGTDGRHVVVSLPELDALLAEDGAERRQRLREIGILRPDAEPPVAATTVEAAAHRVVLPPAAASLSPEATARVVRDVTAAVTRDRPRILHLSLDADVPTNESGLPQRIVESFREATAPRDGDVTTVSLRTPIGAASKLSWVASTGTTVTLTADAEALSNEATATSLAALREAHASAGIDEESAYVVVETSLPSGATPADRIATLPRLGIRYVRLQSPAEERPGLLDALMTVNETGALLVELDLALHLEAMARAGRAGDGRALRIDHQDETSREVIALPLAPGEGCSSCAYLGLCGSTLTESRRFGAPSERWLGSELCIATMSSLDEAFERIAGDGPRTSRVLSRWLRARDRVARRLVG